MGKKRLRFKVVLKSMIVCCGLMCSSTVMQCRADEGGIAEAVTQIEQQDADLREIPDKYNTGAVGELTMVTSECMISGVNFRGSGESDRKLDLYYQSVEIPKEIVVENYDFSSSKFSIQHADKLEYDVNILFRNCKFKSVIIYSGKHANCQFENCTFTHFSGSNATFNNCYFGSGTDGDGINPGENCTFTNCMIADLIHPADEAHDNHVDGFQIFGSNTGEDNVNIHLDNCRFEVPNIPFSKPSGAINCPVTMTMRYSNADDISFENCYVNGGVYYGLMLNQIDQKVTNLSVKNIHLGGNSKSMYVCDIADASEMVQQNVTQTDALYVSSVRRLEDGIHLSVSNDTRMERKLAIVTDQGIQETFLIPACPYGREIEEDTMTYQDFPFDLEYVIPDTDWIVCYDITDTAKQIRFVNWSGNEIYLDLVALGLYQPKMEEQIVPELPVEDPDAQLPDNLMENPDAQFSDDLMENPDAQLPENLMLNLEVELPENQIAIQNPWGIDGTAFGKGADVSLTEQMVAGISQKADPKGTEFSKLCLNVPNVTKNSIRLKWKKVSGASKYVIYGNESGERKKLKKLRETNKATYTVKKIGNRRLKKGTYYTCMVIAYDNYDKVISSSKMVYATTLGGKYGNYKKLMIKNVKKNKIALKKKKSFRLKYRTVGTDPSFKIKNYRKVRFESDNPDVAVVSNKGKIIARKKGKCFVYVYAQNGIYKRIKVTVK